VASLLRAIDPSSDDLLFDELALQAVQMAGFRK